MNATELVAALRADHRTDGDTWCRCCPGQYPWPCPPAVAADRIEAAYEPRYWHDLRDADNIRDALDGAS